MIMYRLMFSGIQKFKEFLTDIGKAEGDSDHANKLQILKEYCDDQGSGDKHATCFLDLISTWSFAAQSNNDSILSAVPAVLSLFLRTVSTQIQFREFGLSLCRTLLEKDQLRLFDRGLTSVKSKEFLISPCLRLLTEIVSFDGGAVANSLYSRRDTVFKRLDVLLDHGMSAKYDDEDQKRKPTVRRNAQRYVLANLKFQSSGVKGDLIAEGKILRRTLQGINRDGSDIIADILRSVKKDILEGTALSRKSKTRFLNAVNLASLASLYSIEDQTGPSERNGAAKDTKTVALPNETLEDRTSVRTQVHSLLLEVCTHQEDGVLLPDSGWYPLGNDPEEPIGQGEEDGIHLGLESPLYFDNYERKIPVKNGTLSTFIEGLRPATDTMQAALILKIFEAAPELVADYFCKKGKFTSEPKPEPGWLGEAAFLFSVIDLPIPAYCGWDAELPATPPPASIVIESILPRPLDRPTVTRCLNLNDEVITLFAARVATVALKKLQKILALFHTAAHEPDLWKQASGRLKKAFSQRCPQIKVVVQALQRASKDDIELRGALVELLAMYFRVLPSLALREKVNVSTALTEVVDRLDVEDKDKSDESELLEQLSNVVFVAEISPLTNWWNKSGKQLRYTLSNTQLMSSRLRSVSILSVAWNRSVRSKS
jgi:nucleolar pre-ribosomal-associated protein 1